MSELVTFLQPTDVAHVPFWASLGMSLPLPYFFLSPAITTMWPGVTGSTVAGSCLWVPGRDPGWGWASTKAWLWPSGFRESLPCWAFPLPALVTSLWSSQLESTWNCLHSLSLHSCLFTLAPWGCSELFMSNQPPLPWANTASVAFLAIGFLGDLKPLGKLWNDFPETLRIPFRLTFLGYFFISLGVCCGFCWGSVVCIVCYPLKWTPEPPGYWALCPLEGTSDVTGVQGLDAAGHAAGFCLIWVLDHLGPWSGLIPSLWWFVSCCRCSHLCNTQGHRFVKSVSAAWCTVCLHQIFPITY